MVNLASDELPITLDKSTLGVNVTNEPDPLELIDVENSVGCVYLRVLGSFICLFILQDTRLLLVVCPFCDVPYELQCDFVSSIEYGECRT